MGKFILIVLLLIAALCGSCGQPLVKAEVTQKIPYISIGNKYVYYTYFGSPGVVRCDTVEVTAIDGPCVHFCHKKDHYIVDKRRFRANTAPIKKSPK